MNQPAPPPRVLVIEDNAYNLELIVYLLRAAGYAPTVARDGPSGLRAAAGGQDLILLDLQMPGMDGFEVLRRLREDASLATVRVVAVTALAMVGDRERVLAAGFDGYVPKPLDPATFAGRIREFLPDSHRAPRTADVKPKRDS